MTRWWQSLLPPRRANSSSGMSADVETVKETSLKPIAQAQIQMQYSKPPSLSAYLPWSDWSDETHTFLLEDGISVGALFELRDRACEALPQHSIEELHQKLTAALSRVVPLEEDNPWVVQFFIQDDPTLSSAYKKLAHYISPEYRQHALTKKYLQLMRAHFETLSQPQGLFDDPLSGIAFRGKTRRIRLALYRRYADKKKPPTQDVMEELTAVSEALVANLQAFGLKIRRLRGRHVYDWLVRWFNPAPLQTQHSVDSLLQHFPYPPDDKKPHGWSFCQSVFFNEPESTPLGWKFDTLLHNVMVCRPLHSMPDIGLISRERSIGDSKFALIDKLPDGCIYTLQITFESKRTLEKHLKKIEDSAVGKGSAPQLVRQRVNQARAEIDNQHLLFRVVQAIYYRASDETDLKTTERQLTALLANAGLSVVLPQHEINRQDTYLRFLPFNYQPQFDKKYLFRAAYQYASDVAALLPLYGRARGDEQFPLNIFFNRGGEAFMFDHLHPEFKMSNSHMAVLGSTGSGKSVFLNGLMFQLLAVKHARVFVIEAGGSFDLFARFVERYDTTVNRLTFERKNPIAVNPFSQAYDALTLIEAEEIAFLKTTQDETIAHANVLAEHAKTLQQEMQQVKQAANEAEQACDANRDLLAEMTLAIRVMVTGGLEKEEARFTLSDDTLILETLIDTIKYAKAQDYPQVLTSHVIEGFHRASSKQSLPDVARRLDEMARALSAFIKNPIKARFFNRSSESLPEKDLTVINLGFLQEKDNLAMMSVVFISLLAKILAIAEANQYGGRPTILIIDEAHIPLKNPLVAVFLTLMAKVARKIGLWLIPTTQNVEDFSTEESKKILSMMETLVCLSLNPKELQHVKKFRAFSEEEEALLLDVKKYPGIYSEGVLLGARYKGLFRNVPPRLMLALAMTEQIEKHERFELMQQYGINELEAAEKVAERLLKKRKSLRDDVGFDDE